MASFFLAFSVTSCITSQSTKPATLEHELMATDSRFPLLFIAFERRYVIPQEITFDKLSLEQRQDLLLRCRAWYKTQDAAQRIALDKEYLEFLSNVSP